MSDEPHMLYSVGLGRDAVDDLCVGLTVYGKDRSSHTVYMSSQGCTKLINMLLMAKDALKDKSEEDDGDDTGSAG